MLSILNKLGSEYSIFVLIFDSERISISNWKIPSLDSFVEFLIQEKEKLVQMEVLQTSKNQALLVTDSTKAQDKGIPKGKEPKAYDLKLNENQKTSEGDLGSKKKKKFEKKMCSYCMRGFNPEDSCIKNQVNQLTSLLK